MKTNKDWRTKTNSAGIETNSDAAMARRPASCRPVEITWTAVDYWGLHWCCMYGDGLWPGSPVQARNRQTVVATWNFQESGETRGLLIGTSKGAVEGSAAVVKYIILAPSSEAGIIRFQARRTADLPV